MQSTTFAQQGGLDQHASAVWGDLYEVAVKRGCLAFLASEALLPEHSRLDGWNSTVVECLHDHLYQQLDIVDRSERARHSSTLNHLLVTGYGLGWTVLRQAVEQVRGRAEIWARGLHCPLHLPDRRGGGDFERTDAAAASGRPCSLRARQTVAGTPVENLQTPTSSCGS